MQSSIVRAAQLHSEGALTGACAAAHVLPAAAPAEPPAACSAAWPSSQPAPPRGPAAAAAPLGPPLPRKPAAPDAAQSAPHARTGQEPNWAVDASASLSMPGAYAVAWSDTMLLVSMYLSCQLACMHDRQHALHMCCMLQAVLCKYMCPDDVRPLTLCISRRLPESMSTAVGGGMTADWHASELPWPFDVPYSAVDVAYQMICHDDIVPMY